MVKVPCGTLVWRLPSLEPAPAGEPGEGPERATLLTSSSRRPVMRHAGSERAVELNLEEEAAPAASGETNQDLVADLTENGRQFVLCKGGRGGLGNRNFATARRQTPRFAQPGEAGGEGATGKIVCLAHAAGIPVEGELGAVLGHEAGPLPPYEELFASGRGFTAVEDARRFVQETGVDWLSVAVGNVHGAISATTRHNKKVEARLNIEHLERIYEAVQIPLVLHGGSGIQKKYVQEAIHRGIAKINIATAIRQPYESALRESPQSARKAAYNAAVEVLREELELQGSRRLVNPEP